MTRRVLSFPHRVQRDSRVIYNTISMATEHWNKVQTLFEAALELHGEERTAYLQKECADDEDLYREVASLLSADENVHDLLKGLAIDVVGWTYEQQYIGKRIGPYRIVKHIGSGGMSYVFLAEREDGQFSQRVALKIIKRGMESDLIIRRFRSERQILSRLDHPNIARLHDGGITEDCTPFFTMDYVDGMPIHQYCDENTLTIDERLELFATVCSAVQFAHVNLVVHRDLKPGNILVNRDGVVKLLDFGIAKLLGEGEDETLRTRTGLYVMTPEYASPEQVLQQPVSTASDVYNLGIVLYELLTGHRPYSLTSSSPSEMERIVCTVQPDRPSARITAPPAPDNLNDMSAEAPERHAAKRKTTAPRLRKLLRGDLDTICLTALRKEPDRRYQTAEQLLRDVQRFRTGLPIAARKDTASYRLNKFIQRRKTAVIASAIAILLLSSLMIYYTVRLADERNTAQHEAVKSEEISRFLKGLFEISNPSEARGETVTARELLDRGALRVRSELADQPEVQATMLDIIGTVYYSLGLYTEAHSLLHDALDMRRGLYDDAHPLVASSLNNLALTLQELGDYAAAEEMIREGLEIQRLRYPALHEDIAASLYNLAEIRRMSGDLEAAEQLFTESHGMYAATIGYGHPSAAAALHSLAVLQNERGDYANAENNYSEALTIFTNVYGEYHPDVGNVLNNLASMYRHRGDYGKAETLYARALDVRTKVLDPDHPDLAYTHNHMGRLYQFTERYVEAERSFLEGLRIREKMLGKYHPVTTASLSALANLYEATGQYETAESLYIDTYVIMLDVWGGDHRYIGSALNNIGRVQHALGKYESAERYLRRSVEHQRSALPEGHVLTAHSLLNLGNLLNDTGRPEEAEAYLRTALALRERNLPEGHHQTETARLALGTSFMQRGEIAQADELFRTAYRTLSLQFGDDSDHTRLAAEKLAELRSRTETRSPR
jgi:eukaryotic-like serine/threonine-protein kinase